MKKQIIEALKYCGGVLGMAVVAWVGLRLYFSNAKPMQTHRPQVAQGQQSVPAKEIKPEPDVPVTSETVRREGMPETELSVEASEAKAPVQDSEPKEHPPESKMVIEEFKLPEKLHPCIQGTVVVTIRSEGQERKVVVPYKMPVDGSGRPLKTAKHMVFEAPFSVTPMKEDYPGIRETFMSGGLGFTVLTLKLPLGVEAWVPRKAEKEVERFWEPQSGVMDAVFIGQRKIAQKHGLPLERLMVMGESMGSAMVQAMAATYPEKIKAAAVVGSPDLIPARNAKEVAWLLVHTRGQSNAAEYREYAADLRKQGARVIYAVTPPLWAKRGDAYGNYNHSPSAAVYSMLYGFFAGIARQIEKDGSGGDGMSWNYVADEKGDKKEILEAGTAAAESVPVGQRVYFPSRACGQIWAGLQPKKEVVAITPGETGLEAFVTRPSIYHEPQGIVLYTCPYDYTTINRIIEDAYYLASRGYIAVAPKNKPSSRAEKWEENFVAALSWIQQQPEMRDMPFYCLGVHEGAAAMLAGIARSGVLPKAVALNRHGLTSALREIGGTVSQTLDNISLPPSGDMRWPLLLVYNEEDKTAHSGVTEQVDHWQSEVTAQGARVSVLYTEVVKSRRSSPPPPKKKKNPDGTVEIIPPSPPSYEDLETPRSWKEIEAIEKFFSEGESVPASSAMVP